MLTSRGFPASNAWIGYAFVFMIPYLFLCAGILSIVAQYVRIEPSRNTVDRSSRKKTEDDASGTADTGAGNSTDNKSDFNLPFTPVDLTFENLVYEVKSSNGKDTIRLLNSVSGAFTAGRMCALMGSSGAGVSDIEIVSFFCNMLGHVCKQSSLRFCLIFRKRR